jgi:hypothetical protein
MSELRTDSREWVHRIMGSLDRMLVGIENLAVGNRPVLGGERYLTDKEVSAQLKLSRRTLQDYRNEGEYPITSWVVKSFTGRVILRKCFRKIIGKHI